MKKFLFSRIIKGHFAYAEFEAGFEFAFCFLKWCRIIRAHLYVSVDILRRIEDRNESATKGFACFWLARGFSVILPLVNIRTEDAHIPLTQ